MPRYSSPDIWGHFAATGQECFVDFTPEQVGKLSQTRRVENIDEERVILIGDFGLVVAELNQSGLTHAARRDDDHVVPIGNGFDEPCLFLHAVAEILRFYFARYDERIRCFRHKRIIFYKSNYLT